MRFAIDEGLNAKADAVHAGSNQRGKGVAGKLSRRALDGDLGIRIEIELRPHRAEEASQQIRSQQAGGSAAQIDGVHAARQGDSQLSGPLT
jgi:uncharacterized Zn-binding protein involved in type VI secretion